MNRALRTGLWILGAGILSFVAMPIIGGTWGPCGPSNGWALILLLVALLATPVGAIVSVVGIVMQRKRPTPQSGTDIA